MDDIKQLVEDMYDSYGLVMLKGGTEWENMDFSEIAYLNTLCLKEVPLMIKVSGPEARMEIRKLMNLGITRILGPMIESRYAMEKFVNTANEIYSRSDIKPSLSINIETKKSVENLDDIINSDCFDQIESVVIGRLDLSNSIGKSSVDDKEVDSAMKYITEKLYEKGKKVSVGGFVNPKSAIELKKSLKINSINTIHALFDLQKAADISQSIKKAIEFEIQLYREFKRLKPVRAAFYDKRIAISQKKLED